MLNSMFLNIGWVHPIAGKGVNLAVLTVSKTTTNTITFDASLKL